MPPLGHGHCRQYCPPRSWGDKPARVLCRHIAAHPCDEVIAQTGGERTVNQNRLKVDHRADRQTGLCQLLGRLQKPWLNIAVEFCPAFGVIPKLAGVDVDFTQAVFKLMNGRHVNELHTFADGSDTAQGSQRTRIALLGRVNRAIEHNAATDKGTDKEIGVILKLFTAAIGVFGLTGRCCIVHQRKADILTEFDPFETGLDRFVHLEKADFIGKAALTERAKTAPKKRLVTTQVDSDTTPARPGASVMLDGKVVGTVSSGGYGHRVAMNLAYAFVDAAVAAEGQEFAIDVLGQLVRALVIAKAQYDAENARVRA